MLKGENIIYFGPGKWEGMWRNRHHLMNGLARSNRVLYVEPYIFLKQLREQVSGQGGNHRELFQALQEPRITNIRPNLYIYHTPLYVPISGRFPLNRLTLWAWNVRLKMTLARLGFRRPIIWLSLPFMVDFVGCFNEKLAIYHVVDDYLAYQGTTDEQRRRTEVLEQKMLKKADLVFVVSDKLLETKGAFNAHTYKVANAVDYDSYDRALQSNGAPPVDIAHIRRPIIGYSGLISCRLDLPLLEKIAVKGQDLSLVLLGTVDDRGCKAEIRALKRLKNVHFLGLKTFHYVPFYVKEFDVCVIPYAICEETKSLSALKLYDFFATGKPLVTTEFPGVSEFEDLIYVSQSQESFMRNIRTAIQDKDSALIERRRHIASQNTWEQRVNQLSHLIEWRLTDRSLKKHSNEGYCPFGWIFKRPNS